MAMSRTPSLIPLAPVFLISELPDAPKHAACYVREVEETYVRTAQGWARYQPLWKYYFRPPLERR